MLLFAGKPLKTYGGSGISASTSDSVTKKKITSTTSDSISEKNLTSTTSVPTTEPLQTSTNVPVATEKNHVIVPKPTKDTNVMLLFAGKPLKTYGGSDKAPAPTSTTAPAPTSTTAPTPAPTSTSTTAPTPTSTNLPIVTEIPAATPAPEPANDTSTSDTKMEGGGAETQAQLVKRRDENFRAQIETGIVAAIFGSGVAYTIYYLGVLFSTLYALMMAFIVFNICLIIYQAIQKILDASRAVVGGVARTMQTAIDKAVIKLKFGKIKFPTIKLLGFLQGPANSVKRVNDKIPEHAYQVILNIMFAFFSMFD
jgi:hypothetical protein